MPCHHVGPLSLWPPLPRGRGLSVQSAGVGNVNPRHVCSPSPTPPARPILHAACTQLPIRISCTYPLILLSIPHLPIHPPSYTLFPHIPSIHPHVHSSFLPPTPNLSHPVTHPSLHSLIRYLFCYPFTHPSKRLVQALPSLGWITGSKVVSPHPLCSYLSILHNCS